MSTSSSPAASPDAFPAVTSDDWAALVRKELKGADPATLFAITRHGYRLQPVYRAEDLPAGIDHLPGNPPYLRGPLPIDGLPGARRHVALQRHVDANLEELQAAIAEDVDGGVDGLWLDLRASGIGSPAQLDAVLDGVDPRGLRRLAVDGCTDGDGRLEMVRNWLSTRDIDPAEVALSLRLDPLGSLARDGALPGSVIDALDNLAAMVRTCVEQLPAALPITLTAAPIHDAGGSLLHSIGWLMANGAWVLRGLEERGLAPARVAARIELHLPLGRDVFGGIAAIRACRLAWTRLLEACGVDHPPPARIHADCSRTAATTKDPWVNALRTTTQVFAGIVGGADAITAAPWDLPLGVPDRDGRRTARNTHFVLCEEAHLGRIVDPAGGSYHLEDYTAELARAGWAAMRSIEARGGADQALLSGWIGERLTSVWGERVQDIGDGKDAVLGTTIYPNPDEDVPVRRPHPVPDIGRLHGVRIDPLPFRPDEAAAKGADQ